MRNLEQLQKQYSRASDPQKAGGRGGQGFGPGRGRNMGMKGKPKNFKRTVGRLLSYVAKYKLRLAFVLTFMFSTTLFSLVGGYMLAPITNRIALHVKGEAPQMKPLEMAADKIIEQFSSIPFIQNIIEEGDGHAVSVYVLAALIILVTVYLVSVVSSYLQSRLMLTVSQGVVERIRNDLFNKLQKLPVKYFDSNPTGEIMSRFTNDIDNIDVMLNNSLTSIISSSCTCITIRASSPSESKRFLTAIIASFRISAAVP